MHMFSPYAGHFCNDESLFDAALTVNDRPDARTAPSTEIKMNEEPKNTKTPKNKKVSLSAKDKKTENLNQQHATFDMDIQCNDSESEFVEEKNLELKLDVDTCSTSTDAKSLAKEIFKLKEQRLCKVLTGCILVTASIQSVDDLIIGCNFSGIFH